MTENLHKVSVAVELELVESGVESILQKPFEPCGLMYFSWLFREDKPL